MILLQYRDTMPSHRQELPLHPGKCGVLGRYLANPKLCVTYHSRIPHIPNWIKRFTDISYSFLRLSAAAAAANGSKHIPIDIIGNSCDISVSMRVTYQTLS